MDDATRQIGDIRARIEELHGTLTRLISTGQPATGEQLGQVLGEVEGLMSRATALEQLLHQGEWLDKTDERLLEESG